MFLLSFISEQTLVHLTLLHSTILVLTHVVTGRELNYLHSVLLVDIDTSPWLAATSDNPSVTTATKFLRFIILKVKVRSCLRILQSSKNIILLESWNQNCRCQKG